MQVVQLRITNFRGVKSAKLNFAGHTLLLGANNVGKSAVCEALDIALGLDRLRLTPLQEYDFYNAFYLDKSTTPPTSIPFEIEVVIAGLSAELSKLCVNRTESWHAKEQRLLEAGELDKVDAADVVECLRLKTVGKYDLDEDDFRAASYFCSGALKPDGSPMEVPRSVRQLIGFVYLRALRTGSRALSLERGSLLDLILQRTGTRTGIWENAIDRLRSLSPPIDQGAVNLTPILENIERRLGQYIQLEGAQATQLFVSQLTREHLRKTLSFFLSPEKGQEPVPFQEVGTGTINALVLALLTFIAEVKKDSVVFAMEEPEIALPPHTQRRITNYLLSSSDQCFVTSHSPYVIEQFQPEQIRVLRKAADGTLSAKTLSVGVTIKKKTYRRHSRRALAEAMLGRGVIITEGISDKEVVLETARKLEETDKLHYPLDLSGISVLAVDGEGDQSEFGAFFTDLGLRTFALRDSTPIPAAKDAQLKASFSVVCQTKYKGIEELLTTECPSDRLWSLLEEVGKSGEKPGLVPKAKPDSATIATIAKTLLSAEKGAGYAARLIELCDVAELPATIVDFLKLVYTDFPPPAAVPKPTLLDPTKGAGAGAPAVPTPPPPQTAQPPAAQNT